MSSQRLIPGGGYVDDSGTAQRLIPGIGYVSENAGGGVTINAGLGTVTYSGYAASLTASLVVSCSVGNLALAGQGAQIVPAPYIYGGNWCWFQDPRITINNNYLYFGVSTGGLPQGHLSDAANFTASISGTVLTVTAVNSANNGVLAVGQLINSGAGVPANTTITSLGTGTGGTGTYNLSTSSTVASESMTSIVPTGTFTGSISGTTLTVSGQSGTIYPGCLIVGSGVAANTYVSKISGGIISVSPSQTVASTSMSATLYVGGIGIVKVNLATGESQVAFIEAQGWVSPDDHADPSFFIRSDGRILVFYSQHPSNQGFSYQLSNSPYDISAWSGRVTLSNGGAQWTYTNPFIMSDGRLVVFGRSTTTYSGSTVSSYCYFSTTNPGASTAAGITWDASETSVRIAPATLETPYYKLTQRGDTIDLFCTDWHPKEGQSSVYHVQLAYSAGAFSALDSSGTSLGALPILSTQGTKIYDGNSTSQPIIVGGSATTTGTVQKAWVEEVQVGPDGQPWGLFMRYPQNAADNDIRPMFSRRQASGVWTTPSEICHQGAGVANTGAEYYTFGFCFDGNNRNVVYVSRNSDVTTPSTVGVSRTAQDLWRYSTSDQGNTWDAGMQLTHNIAQTSWYVEMMRPLSPAGNTGNPGVFYASGIYGSDWQNFALSTSAIVTASPTTFVANLGTVSMAGLSASISVNATIISAGAGAVTETGLAASVGTSTTVSASLGAVTETGLAATVNPSSGTTVSCAKGAVTETGQHATISASNIILAGVGTVATAGVPAAYIDAALLCGKGDVSVTGLPAFVSSGAAATLFFFMP